MFLMLDEVDTPRVAQDRMRPATVTARLPWRSEGVLRLG